MDMPMEPGSPPSESKTVDDTTIVDEGSAIQNRKRRRSSLRRVSFAERPSIHVFARDDDYETPPEGTTSHFSAQSSPSMSRSPQRRSERLAARGQENDMEKENVPVSIDSTARESRRGRRPLAIRETQEEKAEFLKPGNWLDDQEISAFGSCDENTGPIDLRHIRVNDQRMASLEDEDDMTMDSQMFHTRTSLVNVKQPLQPLSEEKFVEVATPQDTDMDLTLLQPERKREGKQQSTWHRGDGSPSDMSLVFLGAPQAKALQREGLATENGVQGHEQNGLNAAVGRVASMEEDPHPPRSRLNTQMERTAASLANDDTISMDTASQSSEEENLVPDERRQASGLVRAAASNGYDDTVSDTTLQSQASQEVENTVIFKSGLKMLEDRAHSAADEDHSGPSKQNGRMFMDVGTSNGESQRSLPKGQSLQRPGYLHSHDGGAPLQTLSQQQDIQRSIVLVRQEMFLQASKLQDTMSVETTSRSQPNMPKSEAQRATVFLADDETVSMDITKALKDDTAHMASAPRRSTDSGKPFFCVDRAQDMDMSDGDSTEKFQDGVTEAIPQLKDLLDAYDLHSPAGPMSTGAYASHPVPHPVLTPALARQSSQRGFAADVETSEARGFTSEIEYEKALSGRYLETGGGTQTKGAEEKEVLSNEVQDKSTGVSDSNVGRELKGFQNPEDTFSFKVPRDSLHQRSARESLVTLSREQASASQQVVTFGQTFPRVQEIVHSIEANLRDNQVASQRDLEQSFQDGDTTGELTGQHNWLADASSDMSTTPISPTRPKIAQNLMNMPQGLPAQTEAELTDSPSLQDGIAAATPRVQDLLADDEGTPESTTAWNPRRISWSAQQPAHQATGDIPALMRQPRINPIEDETILSTTDNLRTPRVQQGAQNRTESIFGHMTEEAEDTLKHMSHTKEVQNSAANRMMQRMMSLKNRGPEEMDSSYDEDSPPALRRSLIFHAQSDGQPQGSLLEQGNVVQQMEGEDVSSRAPMSKPCYDLRAQMQDPTAAMDKEESSRPIAADVDDMQNGDEEAVSTLRRIEKSKREKLAQELQVAQEKLDALEERSAALRGLAQEYHQAIAEICKGRDWSIGTKGWADLSPQTHVNKLKNRCFLLRGTQWWDLKTTKIGDDEVVHEFKYWTLLTHSVYGRTVKQSEVTVTKSTMDLNVEVIDQVFRHMNASLAWQAYLTGCEEVSQPHSLLYYVQDISFKVTMLLDLMGEVNRCRKYLVIPRFRHPTDGGLQLSLQFSNSELLFDFAVLLNLREWLGRKQRMGCDVEMEVAGRYGQKQITVAEIKDAVACVAPGHLRLLRICGAVDSLIEQIRSQPKSQMSFYT